MKFDFHIHTIYSGDSVIRARDLEDKFREKIIDGAVILDHNTLRGGLEFREILDFPIIPGEEIYTLSGEIIGLFLEKEIPPGLSLRETIFRIKEQGGLIYVPHPFTRFTKSQLHREDLFNIIPNIDILEVYNAKHGFWGGYGEALVFCRTYNIIQGAGSDAHHPSQIGKAYVELPDEVNKGLLPCKFKDLIYKSTGITCNTTSPLNTSYWFLKRTVKKRIIEKFKLFKKNNEVK